MASLRERVPWWLKICAKLVLARLPIPYRRWRSVGIFKHGFMLSPDYALEVFLRHYDRVKSHLPSRFTLLELGPGDSLATSVIAAAHGAAKVFLVDIGPFAALEVEPYNQLSRLLASISSNAVPENFHTISEMLETTNTTYLISGLDSLRSLPNHSIDFVFSQAMLEHVPLPEFTETVCELYRLQKTGSIASHRLDLQDHLAHGLNSLRFSKTVWESKLFVSSGFYTNRLRASQVKNIFIGAGYKVLSQEEDKWHFLPIQPSKLHPDYAAFSESDLLVRGLDIVVKK